MIVCYSLFNIPQKRRYGKNIETFCSSLCFSFLTFRSLLLKQGFRNELEKWLHSRVNDVALSVGFLETGTFIRGFKKLEGTTPGAYKNQIQEIGIMDIEQEEENTK